MGLVRRTNFYKADQVGIFAFSYAKIPFRWFMGKNSEKILFKPDLDGARWYNLDFEKLDVEKLFTSENALQAMAYLRSVEGGFELP